MDMKEESKEVLEDPRPQIIIIPRGTCRADDDWVHIPRGYKDPEVSLFREPLQKHPSRAGLQLSITIHN